jgi:hypothetical protein
MKILSILISFFAFQAMAAAAQDGAIQQLKASAPAALAAACVEPPAASAVPSARNTMLLLDPRTGKTLIVIPAGGGFIIAASGKYVPAAYNGSGYILRDGTYMPAIGGGRKASASGRVQAVGTPAKELWKALDFVSKIEDIDFHSVSGDKDVLAAESVSCVDENYVACSMFVNVNGERKLLVTMDAGAKVIRALYSNGFAFDDETGILYAARLSCSRTGEDYSCEIEP